MKEVILWVGIVLMSVQGCAPVLIGAGALGGYAVSRDSVIDHFDTSQGRVFNEALEVIHSMGAVTLQDEQNGVIKARIEGATVTVTVKTVTKKTVKLTIKARNRILMPKVAIAQDVYAGIKDRL